MLGKIKGKRRRGWQRICELRQYHWLNGHEFEQTPEDSEGQRSLACCSPWGRKELDTTLQLNNNILTGVRWYLIAVLICISLIISGVEHLFMFLWSISLSSLEKCLFRSSHIFWFGCLFFWYWATWAICKFWRLIPCCIVCKYFLPFCGLFFLFCLWFPFLCKSFWV